MCALHNNSRDLANLPFTATLKVNFYEQSIALPVRDLTYNAHKDLILKSPLYFKLWGQYEQWPPSHSRRGRTFYRAILGWRDTFDTKKDAEATQRLDDHLWELEERGLLYMKPLRCGFNTKIRGVLWRDGMPPARNRTANFDERYEDLRVSAGQYVLARFNKIDMKPHWKDKFEPGYVDLDFSSHVDDRFTSTNEASDFCCTMLLRDWEAGAKQIFQPIKAVRF